MEKAHYGYAFPVPGVKSDDHYTFTVIQHLLGEFDSSKAHQEYSQLSLPRLSGSNDVGDKYFAFNHSYQDIALCGIYAQVHPYEMDHFSRLAANEFTRLAVELTPTETFEVAKLNAIRSALEAYSSSANVADEIGRQVLDLGMRVHPSEIIAKINAVTPEMVQKAADEYFYDRDFALAAYGPTHELPDYNELRVKTYSFYK